MGLGGTALMSTGAAYGKGVYLGADSSTSFGYAGSSGMCWYFQIATGCFLYELTSSRRLVSKHLWYRMYLCCGM